VLWLGPSVSALVMLICELVYVIEFWYIVVAVVRTSVGLYILLCLVTVDEKTAGNESQTLGCGHHGPHSAGQVCFTLP